MPHLSLPLCATRWAVQGRISCRHAACIDALRASGGLCRLLLPLLARASAAPAWDVLSATLVPSPPLPCYTSWSALVRCIGPTVNPAVKTAVAAVAKGLDSQLLPQPATKFCQ